MEHHPASCPKCGFVLVGRLDSCPKCGVIFAKFSTTKRKVLPSTVRVTTGDIREEYEILQPVYYSVSNKGLFSSQLKKLVKKHNIITPQTAGHGTDLFWMFAGEWPVEYQDFPLAFAVCLEELKIQSASLGGDAIIWLRQDVDLDTNGFQFFYMQAYGTSVSTVS